MAKCAYCHEESIPGKGNSAMHHQDCPERLASDQRSHAVHDYNVGGSDAYNEKVARTDGSPAYRLGYRLTSEEEAIVQTSDLESGSD